MLEQLFGSRTRTKILRLFFTKVNSRFFIREITRILNERINSVRLELEHLEKIGLIKSESLDNKKYYTLNTKFILFNELKELVIKSRFFLEKTYIDKFKKIANIKYLILTGYFVDIKDETLTDILIVGSITKDKIEKIVNEMSDEFMVDLNYTILSPNEFNYRKNMTDRFLYNILKNKKIVVIDKMGIEN